MDTARLDSLSRRAVLLGVRGAPDRTTLSLEAFTLELVTFCRLRRR